MIAQNRAIESRQQKQITDAPVEIRNPVSEFNDTGCSTLNGKRRNNGGYYRLDDKSCLNLHKSLFFCLAIQDLLQYLNSSSLKSKKVLPFQVKGNIRAKRQNCAAFFCLDTQ